MRALNVAVLFASFVTAACSSTPAERDATGTDLLIGGGFATASLGPVFEIAGGCTASFIGSNQVVTAAHCVVDINNGVVTTNIKSGYQSGDPIALSNDNSIDNTNTTWFNTSVLATDLAPDFVTACANGCPQNFALLPPYAPDLAIITLTDPFPGSFGLAALTTSTSPGEAVTETGYGCDQNVNTPATDPLHFKTASATILDPSTAPASLRDAVSDLGAFSQNYIVTAGVRGGGEASICPGDSGGPLFLGGLSDGLIAGVNAYYTFRDSSGVSEVNVFTRIDSPSVSPWISQVLGK